MLKTYKDFIIRQTYLAQQESYVTFTNDHKSCPCRRTKPTPRIYRQGDAVYIEGTDPARLEPVIILEPDKSHMTHRVQLLERLEDHMDIALQSRSGRIFRNELVSTNKTLVIRSSQI